MSVKKKKKVLPAILMAGAMVVPNAAMAAQLAKSMSVNAPDRPAAGVVLDSQDAYNRDSLHRTVQPQWAEVTWEEVVWVRADNRG